MPRGNTGSTKKTTSSRTSKTKIDKNVQVGRIMAEEERTEFYCTCCGKKYTKQKGNFPFSNSPLFAGNGGYTTICKTCVDKYFHTLTDGGKEPDIVMASCGDAPTLETLAAISILRKNFPEVKIRMVNVVDLMKLQSNYKHPHGMTDEEYNAIFTKDKPIIFNFHGYPDLIHQLTYNRENQNIHVHGYIEEGTITTSFDMKVQNKIDRYNLVIDALKYLPELGNRSSFLIEECKNKLIEHKAYISEYGIDMEEVRNWHWQ